MLNNKKFNIILSVLIAISLWAYVIGETNPVDKEVFRDVPIEFINAESIEQNGWAVQSVSATSVNMTITGTRMDVKKVTRRDVSAYVDLAETARGTNEIKVNFKVPDNVELEDKSINKVTVTIENSKTRDVKVVPLYLDEFDENQEAYTSEQSIETVTVTGAESKVDQIESVKAVVEEGEVEDSPKKIRCRLMPVDKLGNKIRNISLSAYYADLTVELVQTRTVSLEVPVTDNTADIIEKKIVAPSTVTIKGSKAVIDEIEKITTEEVDISDIDRDTEIELEPVLPEGVNISSKSGKLRLKVTVEEPEVRTFELSESDITVHGLDEDLEADINDVRIEITLRGKGSVIDDVVISDFRIYINAEDLEEGRHTGRLYVTCEKECGEMTFTPEKVKFTLNRRN